METVGHNNLSQLLYLVAAVLFILGLKGMTKVRSARRGNLLSSIGMLLAVVGTLIEIGAPEPGVALFHFYMWIIVGVAIGTVIGAVSAMKVPMTMMPEMVAIFNGFGGGASMLVAISEVYLEVMEKQAHAGMTVSGVLGGASAFTVVLSILVGAVTFSGSMIAYLKLQGKVKSEPVLIPGRHVINALLFIGALVIGTMGCFFYNDFQMIAIFCWVAGAISLVLGVMLVIPIGGADMPVVISLLNSYSGIAAGMTGFVINNNMLIVAGALVGASGLILTQIMCKAMNRSLVNVVFGGFGAVEAGGQSGSSDYGQVRSGGPEEAAMLLDAAERVMIVPGYGLAVAQAQHTVKEIADLLAKHGTKVEYAIHPVAGRMPGHMNVLLAEADVPYDKLLELDSANAEFSSIDVALVVGANDVVNPVAETDPTSPIAGMPILQTHNARSVIVIKRSLSPGFANIKNPLFENPKTMMLFADAKKALQGIVAELKESAA